MFRRKKAPQPFPETENPLARRVRQEAEPDTVDLVQPARFPPPEETPEAAPEDPQTADLQTDAARLGRVLSSDPGTGKVYVHPGTEDRPVLLQGDPVQAPTELRAGDTINIGSMEIHIRSL